MQGCAPEAVDLTRETEATRKLYGLDDTITEPFGRLSAGGDDRVTPVSKPSCELQADSAVRACYQHLAHAMPRRARLLWADRV
jgi:hypothetical protein